MGQFNIGARMAAGLCAIVLALTLGAGSAAAHDIGKRSGLVTKLDKQVLQTLRKWLKDPEDPGTTPPPIDFKVRAEIETRVICQIGPSGLRCYDSLVSMRCPSAADVEIPGGGVTTVPLDCTGPDANGECDCEFAGG